MSSTDPSALDRAADTTRRYRDAVERADVEAFMATLAPDVVLRSPITTRIEFRGHDEIRTLMRAVFASIRDIHYYADVGDAGTRALFYRARVGRRPVEEASLVRLGDDALVREITLWFRPLPGLTAVMGRLGPRLARERGPARGALAAALVAPLVMATRAGDAIAVALVGAGARPRDGAAGSRPS